MADFKEEQRVVRRGETKNPITKDKLKEYGKEAFTPVINLLFKYQDRLTPYLHSLSKGLEAAGKELMSEKGTREDKFIGPYFNEACEWTKQMSSRLEEKDIEKINSFIKEQSDKRPGVAFGSSYLIGLVFTRIIRHSFQGPKQQQPVLH